jgi:hypothetical protein
MFRRSSWALGTWYFGTKSAGWVAMDSNASEKLDDAVQQGLRTTSFRIGGQRYSFDLDAKIQTNESSKVRRPISSQGPSGYPSPALPSSATPDSSSGASIVNPVSGSQSTPATSTTQPPPVTTTAQQNNKDKLAVLKQSMKDHLNRLSSASPDANSSKPITRRQFARLTKRSFCHYIDLLSGAYQAEICYRAAKEDALRKEVQQLRLALRAANRNRRRRDNQTTKP